MNTIKVNVGKTQMVAHRGVSGLETQNTAAAFVAAGNRSYYGIETDVHRTSDGKYVVIHDGNTAAVADTVVDIASSTYDTLQSIQLNAKEGGKRSDLRIPLLDEYIRICKKYDKTAVLELKDDFSDQSIREITDMIASLGYLDRTIFIAFNIDNLIKVRKLYPQQTVQFLCDAVTDEIAARLVELKMDLDVGYRCLTARRIEQLHQAGIRINCWTCDNKEDAERLAQWGVDYITSNILE